MIRSMTGYGAAEGKLGDSFFKVEIRSLNSRYFEFSSRVPAYLNQFEDELKKIVLSQIKRGKVNLTIVVSNVQSLEQRISIDEDKVKCYVNSLKRIGKKLGLDNTIVLSDVLSFPDIFITEQKQYSGAQLRKTVLPVVKKALAKIMQAKEKEGATLFKDFMLRINKIKKYISGIEQCARQEPARYKEQLTIRINELASNIKLNPEKLEEEVAYFADRADITEELVRLASHLESFQHALNSQDDAGKKLDFLVQEIHREANTIGSKSSSIDISKKAINVKLEIAKIKEQVQNIE